MAWPSPETFNTTINGLTVAAFHVENHLLAGVGNKASDSNPAALLVQYTRNGRVCGVSDTSDFRCSFNVPAADLASGAWTKVDYNDSTWTNPAGLGTNQAGGFNGKDSVWYSSNQNKPIPGVVPYAQWIWGAPYAAGGGYSDMYCRTFVPNLFC